jgi:hypothetical protein
MPEKLLILRLFSLFNIKILYLVNPSCLIYAAVYYIVQKSVKKLGKSSVLLGIVVISV